MALGFVERTAHRRRSTDEMTSRSALDYAEDIASSINAILQMLREPMADS